MIMTFASVAPPGRDRANAAFHGFRRARRRRFLLHPWLRSSAPPGPFCGGKRVVHDVALRDFLACHLGGAIDAGTPPRNITMHRPQSTGPMSQLQMVLVQPDSELAFSRYANHRSADVATCIQPPTGPSLRRALCRRTSTSPSCSR